MNEVLTKIMLVEDDPDIREIAVFALSEIGGFNIIPCSSGQEALNIFSYNQPQLLILDVMMPGMDGPSTLKNFRALYPNHNIPIIFMTARIQPSEVKEYFELGASGVIQKPFDPILLAEEIRSIWSSNCV